MSRHDRGGPPDAQIIVGSHVLLFLPHAERCVGGRTAGITDNSNRSGAFNRIGRNGSEPIRGPGRRGLVPDPTVTGWEGWCRGAGVRQRDNPPARLDTSRCGVPEAAVSLPRSRSEVAAFMAPVLCYGRNVGRGCLRVKRGFAARYGLRIAPSQAGLCPQTPGFPFAVERLGRHKGVRAWNSSPSLAGRSPSAGSP